MAQVAQHTQQQFTADGTRQERTGWRDDAISKRHRRWGFDCPAVDLDFVAVEYNHGKPVAIIEYKHHRARMPALDHPTIRALADLASGYRDSPLPFAIVKYWRTPWAFEVRPVNNAAARYFRDPERLTEYEYVQRLYLMRRATITQELEHILNKTLPENMDE